MPTPEKGERWGILGGAFDPVHNGHINLARDIHLKKHLDGVLLVPAYRHPFKQNQAVASYEDRVAMLRLAASEHDFLVVDELEKDLELSGLTLDTVRAVKTRYPQTEFYFLVGADNIDQVSKWHQPEEILAEIEVIAGTRPTFFPKEICDTIAERIEYIETSPVDVSSSEIRDLLRSGEGIERLAAMVDRKVNEYILSRRLYQ